MEEIEALLADGVLGVLTLRRGPEGYSAQLHQYAEHDTRYDKAEELGIVTRGQHTIVTGKSVADVIEKLRAQRRHG
jgi:hypothetical protein